MLKDIQDFVDKAGDARLGYVLFSHHHVYRIRNYNMSR